MLVGKRLTPFEHPPLVVAGTCYEFAHASDSLLFNRHASIGAWCTDTHFGR